MAQPDEGTRTDTSTENSAPIERQRASARRLQESSWGRRFKAKLGEVAIPALSLFATFSGAPDGHIGANSEHDNLDSDYLSQISNPSNKSINKVLSSTEAAALQNPLNATSIIKSFNA